jgi:predicted phage terminase large subunit-like protein
MRKYDLTKISDLRILSHASLMAFFAICLGHYAKKKVAKYHHSIVQMLEGFDEATRRCLIVGYPGSAKSSFISLAYPIWLLATRQVHFIVLIGDTQRQSNRMIANIRHEIENNKLLLKIFPHLKEHAELNATNLEIAGMMVMAISRGQNMRGMRYKEHRPEVIIIDDPEALDHVKTKQKRDDTDKWFTSEIVPRLSEGKTKIVVTGNLLHNDSFIARLSHNEKYDVLRIPIVRKDGSATWPDMFPTQAEIDAKKADVKSNATWSREYMLQPLPEDTQVVKELLYVDKFPAEMSRICIGTDLAISKKETADYTGLVAVGETKEGQGYVLRAKRGRWNFNETMDQAFTMYTALREQYPTASVKIGFEKVGYQEAAIEEFEKRYRIPVIRIQPVNDKKAKLESISWHLETGAYMFPQHFTGDMEVLENEVLYFGVEEHDDLMDALIIAIKMLLNKSRAQILFA